MENKYEDNLIKEVQLRMLGSAITIASAWHLGQFDKAGLPYILHPIHVMNKVWDKYHDPELAQIAVLHDIIEDTNLTLNDLQNEGFSIRVLKGVDSLTHPSDESYDSYIDRISENIDAIKVKLEDLDHNTDLTRLVEFTKKDSDRMAKYHSSYTKLKVILG
jgi:(p)ppGpp synthase/HD superfamily hydrolase